MELRNVSLVLAESLDAWRVIPRIMLVGYSWLVLNLYVWYKSIPTYVQEKCDAAVVSILIEKGFPIEQIQAVACTVADVVGGPTAAQSAFVTTIIGLSAGIFGLYTATGRKWDNWSPPEDPDSPYKRRGREDHPVDGQGGDGHRESHRDNGPRGPGRGGW